MKRAAHLFSSGILAAGILGIATFAWACDKQPAAQSSCCASSCAAMAAAATPAPAVPAAATPASGNPAPTASAAEPGMRIHLDPETGVVGGPGALPPLTEAALLQPEVQEELVPTVLPDGSVMVDLKGRGQEYFVLQLDANGQRVVRCVQDPKAALEPAPGAKPEER